MEQSRNRFRKIERGLAGLFIALAALVVVFLLAEVVSRLFTGGETPVEYDYPPGATRAPKPYVMYGGLPNVKDLNELGYRGPAPQMPKPAEEYRIVLLGGSTVFLGFPSIAERLQQLLQESGQPQARVYNFGVISSVSGTELARLVFEAADVAPDLVLFYNGGNDLLGPVTADPRPGMPYNYVIYENNPLFERNPGEYPLLALLLNGSNLCRIVFRPYLEQKFLPLERLKAESGAGSAAWEAAIAENYLRNMRKAAQVAHGFGAQCAVFFQPLVYYKNPRTKKEAELIAAFPQPAEYFERLRESITSGTLFTQPAEAGLFFDLSGVFEGESAEIFSDVIHLNQSGNERITQGILEHIVPLIQSDPKNHHSE